MQPPIKAKSRTIGLWEAVAIAVGTMIGASIFSIFGVGVQIAGDNLPEAFVLSGLFAVIVAYSYGKLGSAIISNAGPIEFILRGIGDNVVTGSLAILMWLSYVVSIALFADGFAGYFLPLINVESTFISTGITGSAFLVIFTVINTFGGRAVGRSEVFIVGVKLAILWVFIILGMIGLHRSYIIPSTTQAALDGTLSAAVVFFLSYMGFGLVTNASENIDNAKKNVPRAIFISIGVVMVVYVLVSLAAIGSLPVPQLMQAAENALAVAAKPFLGSFGFILISIGALFSISSALNATLFGGANIAYSLAKNGELPKIFQRRSWRQSPEGLYITAALGMALAFLFRIGSIAAITSAIFTIIYIFVLISHYRLAQVVGGNRPLIVFNAVVMAGVLAALLNYQWHTERVAFWGTLIALFGALLFEIVYRSITGRGFHIRAAGKAMPLKRE
jgi:amino acid transporter